MQIHTLNVYYPLIFYHLSFRRYIRNTNIIRHKIVYSKEELIKHYNLTVLKKVYVNTKFNNIVHCPKCECHRIVKIIETMESNDLSHCNQCGTSFLVLHEGIKNSFTTIDTF